MARTSSIGDAGFALRSTLPQTPAQDDADVSGDEAYFGESDPIRHKGDFEFAAEEARQYENIAAVPEGGAALFKTRKRFLEFLPAVKSHINTLLSRAEREALWAGERRVKENIQKLVHAQQIAGAANTGASRCGVLPDDPDYARVCQTEEQLGRYMAETIHLHKLASTYRREMEKWRDQVAEILAQQPELLSIFKTARRQNQLFQAVTKKPVAPVSSRSSSALQSRAKRPATDPGSYRPGSHDLDAILPGTLMDLSARGAAGKAKLRPMTTPSETPRRGATNRGPPHSARLYSSLHHTAGESACSSSDAGTSTTVSHLTPRSGLVGLPARATPSEQHGDSQREAGREQEYLSEIRSLEVQIKTARKKAREMKDSLAKGFIRRGWQEEFFLLCMDDVRKHVLRHKSLVAAQSARLHPKSYSVQTAAAEPSTNSGLGSATQDSRARCQQLLELLVTSDELLASFFEKLFPHREPFHHQKRGHAVPETPESLPPLPPELLLES
jgi:hypothetical protein